MKILLAPSETKKSGGGKSFDLNALFLENIIEQRELLFGTYHKLIASQNLQALSKMFGLKNEQEIVAYRKNIVNSRAMKAIERYTGVAFEYLDYHTLDHLPQQYIDSHVILFSNLFGPLRASDLIPEYKLKQGEMVDTIKTEKFYHTHTKKVLDTYFESEEILDLRAGFYDKFYIPQKPYTTLKFIKEGKVVSHWAKAYRGIVLRHIAQEQIETMEDFMKLPITGLTIEEIKTIKNKTEITYQIG